MIVKDALDDAGFAAADDCIAILFDNIKPDFQPFLNSIILDWIRINSDFILILWHSH